MTGTAAMNAALSGMCRLSSLGLPGHEVVPHLLRRLHGAIGSATNTFHWVDADGQLIDYYSEPPYLPDVARQMFDAAHGVAAAPAHRVFGRGRWLARRTPLPPRFHESEPYRRFWRPRGLHHALEAVVGEGRRPLGMLMLYRGERDPEFAQEEVDTLTALLPLFARACIGQAAYDGEREPGAAPALAVIGDDGEIEHADDEARLLLALALHPCLNLRACGRGCTRADAGVALRLAALSASLRADGLRVTTLDLRNRWGCFRLRARVLEPVRRGTSARIGLALEQRVPLPIAVDAALERTALSPRQRELSLLLAQGCTYAQMGERMGISEQTAISYARVVFEKLGVRNREELLRALLLAPRQ